MKSDASIIENNRASMNKYGHGYGSQLNEINEADLKALRRGKLLAFSVNGGEYVLFIGLNKIK